MAWILPLTFIIFPRNLSGKSGAQAPGTDPAPSTESQTETKNQNPLVKTYVVLDAPKLKGPKRKSWNKICGAKNKKPAGLAKLLNSGITKWGDKVVCLESPQKLPKSFKGPQGSMVLILKWDKSTLDLTLEHRTGQTTLPLTTYRLGLGADPLNELSASGKALDVIAQMLVEASPFGWQAEAKEPEPGMIDFTFVESENSLPLPEYLYVYRLEIQPSSDGNTPATLMPTIHARLKRSNQKSLDKDKNTNVKYLVTESYRPLQGGTLYRVHTEFGPCGRQADFDKKLKAALKGSSLLGFVDDLIFGTLSSNYGGVRIGKSFIVDSLLSKTFLVSALAEIRGGPLQGLRWYYDIVPQVKSTARGAPESFRLARASLGWSFDIDMPSPVSDYIKVVDFQPKIGLLDLKTNLVIQDTQNPPSDAVTSLSFEARNVLDLAGELGFEQQTSNFRARVWTSVSGAAFGVSNKEDVKVFSSRTGLDFYYDLLGLNLPFSTSLLAFGMFENLSLSKDPTKIQKVSGVGISSISFSTFFLGGGLTLSW